MQIVRSAKPISDIDRDKILFRGGLVVFNQISALEELQFLLDQVIQDTLDGCFVGSGSKMAFDFNAKMVWLQQRFKAMPQARALFIRALEQSGMDLEHNLADTLFLRCVPPTEKSKAQFRGSIGYHRDTWGSNIQEQINWWTPLYPLSEENTLMFYPDFWEQPVANTTDEWSMDAFRAARRVARSKSADAQIDYPYAPQAKGAIDLQKAVPILINPGDLLCFSSAHLHSSSPEPRSGFRFNLEMRSVCSVHNGSGTRCAGGPVPPINIDNAQCTPHYHWFKPLK